MRRLACVIVIIGLAGARAAHADEPPIVADSAGEARQQYQEGTKAFSAKRYSEAALHFEAAAAFKANAVALYTAGLAWDLAVRPERAADAYARALDVPGLDPKHTGVAKERITALEKTLGTAVVTSAEGGWKVQLDSFTEVTTPARLHALPGPHVLHVRIPNRQALDHQNVTLEAGKVTPVDVKDELKTGTKVEPAMSAGADRPQVQAIDPDVPPQRLYGPPFWTPVKVLGVGLLGLGVAALGSGIVLGTSANGAKEAYDAAPSRRGFDHASSLETWTNVALIGGAVLAAAGVTLMVVPLEREIRVNVAAAPNALLVRGTF